MPNRLVDAALALPALRSRRHPRLECRRIFTQVLRLPAARLGYVLNHRLPYDAVAPAEFAAATGTHWIEIPFGGDGPSLAALAGR